MSIATVTTLGFGSFGSIGFVTLLGFSPGYAGPVAPKIQQLENMLAASVTFMAAVGADTPAAAKDSIHYDYALLDEEGCDPALALLRLVDAMPCAIILQAEQLQYLSVTFSGRHRLRAEGAMGLLLFAHDITNGDIDANSLAKRKESWIDFRNFHRGVIEEIVDQAGVVDGVPALPIDEITLSIPPTRTNPLLDAAQANDPGEFLPFWMCGYTIHWK